MEVDVTNHVDQSRIITLVSNTFGEKLHIKASHLHNLPYFKALFESSIADASNTEIQVARLPNITITHERLLFESYLPFYQKGIPFPMLPTLKDINVDRATFRDFVLFARLGDYYGVNLFDEVGLTIQDRLAHSNFRCRSLSCPCVSSFESARKAFRALCRETGNNQHNMWLFEHLLKNKLPLKGCHSMSISEQELFWPEFIVYAKAHATQQCQPFIKGYISILVSFPVRPPFPLQGIIESHLAQHLDEFHFREMRARRPSLCARYGDLAYHSTTLVNHFQPKQLLWYWLSLTDDEKHFSSSSLGESLVALRNKIRRLWPTMVISGDLNDVINDQSKQLELQKDIGVR